MKNKAIVYCVKEDQLLVFRHSDFSLEEVGIQVPAGTIKENELPRDAALRELCEETGFDCFEIVSELGTTTYNMAPNRDEVQNRFFFLAKPTNDLPKRWPSSEDHDGLQSPTNFECFWIPLARGHVLEAGQGAMLYRIAEAA